MAKHKEHEPVHHHTAKAAKVGFEVGDHVMVKDQGAGVVREKPELAPEYVAKHGQHYSVLLDSEFEPFDNGVGGVQFKHKTTGEIRDHQHDAIGCVPEHLLSSID